jgi:6-pyruvoyltetrahydropterin/6-carboxytetrahydropterin synthase
VISAGSNTLKTEGNTRGMVVDFSELKADLKEMVDYFDHKLIIEEGSLKAKTLEALAEEDFAIVTVPMRPTAENFSKYFYDAMTNKGYHIVETVVYETPNNCAAYRGE